MRKTKGRKPKENLKTCSMCIRCTKAQRIMIRGWAKSKRQTITDAIIGMVSDDCRQIGERHESNAIDARSGVNQDITDTKI